MNPVCASNCNTFDLGALAYNPCAPLTAASQLRRLFIGKPNASAFADWKSPTEWNTRVSQVSTNGDNYIRALTITGDKPVPAPKTKTIENGIKINQGKDHTVNFTTYQVSNENYEFMRNTECAIQVRLFGIETMGGVMFGSNTGVLVNIIMDILLAGGDDDLEALTGSLTWSSKFSLERASSPIFDIDFNANGGAPSSFDTTQTFTSAVTKTNNGITTVVPATDTDLKFEFNKILSPVGTPATMVLKLVSATVATIDYPADYAGAAWRFTDAAGNAHTGVFTSGNVTLT